MLTVLTALLSCTLGMFLVVMHPDSLSSSQILVDGERASLALRCQLLSLLEVLPQLDANLDGDVSAAELAAERASVFEYVGEHYQLTTATDRDFAGGERLVPIPIRLTLVPPEPDLALGYRRGEVDLEFSFEHHEPIRDLAVEMTLFLDTSPLHIDYTTVQWRGEGPSTFALESESRRVRIDPTGRGAFWVFLSIGRRHILGGWDHLAFLVALVLSARRLRSLLAVVTAFTVAHSITLGLSALNVVDCSAYSRMIEAAVALSIAYVAVDNLVHPQLKRARWAEALGFGLIHGLAFASFLGQSLVEESAKVTPLFAFNLGVEMGQVLVAVALAILLRLVPRGDSESDPLLAPPWLRRGGSIVVAALGLFWFFERI